MRKYIHIVTTTAAMLVMLGTTPIALAATTSGNAASSTPASSATTPAATPKKTLAERIAEYKAKQTLKLTAAQEVALKAKCKASQVVTKTLATTVTTNDTTRTKTYTEIAKNLSAITTRLQDADIDTATLQTQQKKLTELIADYSTNVKDYKAVLADLNELDCVTDPAAYKATLEAARTARDLASKNVQAIHTYLTDTVKPELKALQTKLETTKQQGDQ